jgi:hypothetical protein
MVFLTTFGASKKSQKHQTTHAHKLFRAVEGSLLRLFRLPFSVSDFDDQLNCTFKTQGYIRHCKNIILSAAMKSI